MIRRTGPFNVEEKPLDPIVIAGLRMKGKYSDCGKVFGQLYRQAFVARAMRAVAPKAVPTPLAVPAE